MLHIDDRCVMLIIVCGQPEQCPALCVHREVTTQFSELHLWHHLCQFLSDGIDMLEIQIDDLCIDLATSLSDFQTVEMKAEIVLQHLFIVSLFGEP